jgi:Raf kinase inhibitor-like YbhB/YbcL family protein
MARLSLSSPAFADRGTIPEIYSCKGKDINPPLVIDGVPENSKSLALTVDDPDAPNGLWVHWLVWNINPHTHEIPEDSVPREAVLGKNDWHRNSYGGPCPPSGKHRYQFTLYALDASIDLAGTATKQDLEEAMEGHVIDKAQLIGTFSH